MNIELKRKPLAERIKLVLECHTGGGKDELLYELLSEALAALTTQSPDAVEVVRQPEAALDAAPTVVSWYLGPQPIAPTLTAPECVTAISVLLSEPTPDRVSVPREQLKQFSTALLQQFASPAPQPAPTAPALDADLAELRQALLTTDILAHIAQALRDLTGTLDDRLSEIRDR